MKFLIKYCVNVFFFFFCNIYMWNLCRLTSVEFVPKCQVTEASAEEYMYCTNNPDVIYIDFCNNIFLSDVGDFLKIFYFTFFFVEDHKRMENLKGRKLQNKLRLLLGKMEMILHKNVNICPISK